MTDVALQRPPTTASPQAKPDAVFDRAAVTLIIFAGIVTALHVGKGPIALPEMEQAFGRSLAALSGMLSVFAIVGLIGGMAAGLLAQRLGDRRVLVTGLAILGLASLAGAPAPGYGWLLGTRIVEGLGFLLVVVAAPAALNRLTPPARRSLVFGFWGSFMAIGIAGRSLVRRHPLGHHLRPQPGIRGQHAMEPDQVQSGARHQRSQPLHEPQRAHDQVRRPVTPRRLEPEPHLAVGVDLHPLL